MSRIALIKLQEGGALAVVAGALPHVEVLAVPFDGAGVAALRARLLKEAQRFDGFIIAVGPGQGSSVVEGGWRNLEAPLRSIFAVLTGAAAGLRAHAGGSIVILLPSFALVPPQQPGLDTVYLRAILGMAEALRAELGAASTRMSIVFYAADASDDTLGLRLQYALAHAPMYSLSPDLAAERIRAYFEPMLDAIDRSSAGPPLPDIGPMAVVYDPASIGLPDRT